MGLSFTNNGSHMELIDEVRALRREVENLRQLLLSVHAAMKPQGIGSDSVRDYYKFLGVANSFNQMPSGIPGASKDGTNMPGTGIGF
jgi:hypothetical protein